MGSYIVNGNEPSEIYESPTRSNTVKIISIILTILSVIGSFVIADKIGGYDVYTHENVFEGSIFIYGLIYTVIQAFIMYCIYTHIEYQEQQIKLLKDIRQSLNKDKENS